MTDSSQQLSGGRWRLLRRRRVGAIANLSDHTSTDPDTGAVLSVQAADVLLAEPTLREVWSPEHLERLARTYWRFLARVTLGVVHVHYHERGRALVLLVAPLKLISFAEPEYELEPERGLVRWRIKGGLLVAGPRRRGVGATDQGHLQIEVRRADAPDVGHARVHIEVEVASFYPAIAFAFSRRIYDITQARIHVLVTHAFLRSLVRTRSRHGLPHLAGSKVRRFSRAARRHNQGPGAEPPAAPSDAEPPAAQPDSEPPAAQAS